MKVQVVRRIIPFDPKGFNLEAVILQGNQEGLRFVTVFNDGVEQKVLFERDFSFPDLID